MYRYMYIKACVKKRDLNRASIYTAPNPHNSRHAFLSCTASLHLTSRHSKSMPVKSPSKADRQQPWQ
jgi:hypothetical protein